MPYNAVKMKDWQISEAAEKNMPSPDQWREKLNLQKEEVIPYGRLARMDFMKIMNRLKDKPDGKYIEVTAITPTPLGEGKSTTSCGLMEGLGKRGVNVGGALRQPSRGSIRPWSHPNRPAQDMSLPQCRYHRRQECERMNSFQNTSCDEVGQRIADVASMNRFLSTDCSLLECCSLRRSLT